VFRTIPAALPTIDGLNLPAEPVMLKVRMGRPR
jgi:hypothetical protein